MAQQQIEIQECDEAGNITATYVHTGTDDGDLSRVDIILPGTAKSTWQRALDVFLPAGYPHSVTEDYLEYQIYDSLQAFSSSIAGLLSSRAVLASVGVGDANASATAALLLTILQESVGRIATIMFAHRFGTMLEPECKMYRLLADVLNDCALVLDCLSPAFPKAVRVVILSLSSLLRALCGVAAGSAKASLSAHFARWGNLGELNAKDSSQETVISLLGMLAGSLVIPLVTTTTATWSSLVLLLAIHLETNRRAVRAVSLRTLNRQRANLLYHHLIRGQVPTPQEISKEEQIFRFGGALRDDRDSIRGHCEIMPSFSSFLGCIARPHGSTKSTQLSAKLLPRILKFYAKQQYILWYNVKAESGPIVDVHIAVKKAATPKDMLVAWMQANNLADNGKRSIPLDDTHSGEAIRESMEFAIKLMAKHAAALEALGWDLSVAALETSTNRRFVVA